MTKTKEKNIEQQLRDFLFSSEDCISIEEALRRLEKKKKE